ncbi:MAG: NAD(+) diphosphatase [Deltaproteobacteria bacterium]|nr:NAD(+) diphosphatase [Deltaproteobacteria bacterium]
MKEDYPPHEDLFFIISEKKVTVKLTEVGIEIPNRKDLEEGGLKLKESYPIGNIGDLKCYCAEIAKDKILPKGFCFLGIWRMFNYLDLEKFRMLLKGLHFITWMNTERHCRMCGALLLLANDVKSKFCPSCGMIVFPRISPAVIVLIYREKEILLARSKMFKDELFSCIAGFVEPGETLEDAVTREVKEELGIEVHDIKYFGSQPWPFPDSLMIAFTARFKSGELRVDTKELVEAKWFKRGNLPKIPGPISIARQMIDSFFSHLS